MKVTQVTPSAVLAPFVRMLAKFRDAGAGAFFDVPLHEMFGQSLSLGEVLPRADVEDMALRVQCAKTNGERLQLLERFLVRQLVPNRADRLVAAVADAIRMDPTQFRVATAADRLGISIDALEKRFRRSVGASPKQLASLLRLRGVVRAHRPTTTLTQLALDGG